MRLITACSLLTLAAALGGTALAQSPSPGTDFTPIHATVV